MVWLDAVTPAHAYSVGPKMASLAEVRQAVGSEALVGARVPDGFVVAREIGDELLADLRPVLRELLRGVAQGERSVHDAGHMARELILGLHVTQELRDDIGRALDRMEQAVRAPEDQLLLAVRSSAAAEDLPGASFAGQYDSHLGVHGVEQVLDTYLAVLASLYTDRAISYRSSRRRTGALGADESMAVGVQQLVRADLGGRAGVMMTRDPDAADHRTAPVLIEAVQGLGDRLVSGTVDPERYLVDRDSDGSESAVRSTRRLGSDDAPLLDDGQVADLVRVGLALERRAGRPLDVEWAIDGPTRDLFVVQSRPITASSGITASARTTAETAVTTVAAGPGRRRLTSGAAIGHGHVTAPLCVLRHPLEDEAFVDGAILVTATTDPSWTHLMQRCSAIVTDQGGRTSHAAIVARELGLLAVLGCQDATTVLAGVATATVVCDGDGSGVVLATPW